eukprot:CAMPEP_0118644632 /NCGR_PEP_ID=MMETSP0785-20121206/7052_1 /TAXON_ID=91992 /ORGANISM="Bolidomonas pacifica, Strain CCMP 1866" /LENGTH=495 /DNA_ID=CAMNT_0006536423 /DNA_START=190 /DNA_END=1674 /DNA_ORIENTATION=-
MSSRNTLADDDTYVPSLPSGQTDNTELSTLEEELLLLATNFLLYVALLIILYFVCQNYFPWTVEGIVNAPFSSHSQHKEQEQEQHKHKHNAQSGVKTGNLLFQDSDDDDNEEEDDDVEGENKPFVKPLEVGGGERRKSFVPMSLNHTPSIDSTSTTDHTPLQTDTPTVVFKRLLLCSAGLIVTFVTWGLLQERMLTRRYPRLTGDYFEYTYFLVFTNRLWSLIFSTVLMHRQKRFKWPSGVLIQDLSYSAVSNMLSSWCQYEALKYVTFPAQTLFKSFKILPVMLMGKFLRNQTYPLYEYVVSLVVGMGLTFFLSSSEDINFDNNNLGGQATKAGVVLLLLFLVFDSFTGQWQSRMFQRHKELTVVEMLFANNLFSTVLSLITLIHEGDLAPALDFVETHSEIHFHFFFFSVCSTVGQLLIFYTIRQFGAVVFAIIMTVRVLVSIVASSIIYDHPMTAVGLMGLVMVMSAVGYRTARKARGSQLLKFKILEDERK